MQKENIIAKINAIIDELKTEYSIPAKSNDRVNEADLELMEANGRFLNEHIAVLRKILADENKKSKHELIKEEDTSEEEKTVPQPKPVNTINENFSEDKKEHPLEVQTEDENDSEIGQSASLTDNSSNVGNIEDTQKKYDIEPPSVESFDVKDEDSDDSFPQSKHYTYHSASSIADDIMKEIDSWKDVKSDDFDNEDNVKEKDTYADSHDDKLNSSQINYYTSLDIFPSNNKSPQEKDTKKENESYHSDAYSENADQHSNSHLSEINKTENFEVVSHHESLADEILRNIQKNKEAENTYGKESFGTSFDNSKSSCISERQTIQEVHNEYSSPYEYPGASINPKNETPEAKIAEEKPIEETIQPVPVNNRKSFNKGISISERLAYVKYLFNDDINIYRKETAYLDSIPTKEATLDYINNECFEKYNWSRKPDIADRFMQLVNKRFTE